VSSVISRMAYEHMVANLPRLEPGTPVVVHVITVDLPPVGDLRRPVLARRPGKDLASALRAKP
jgi:hypothetical protein